MFQAFRDSSIILSYIYFGMAAATMVRAVTEDDTGLRVLYLPAPLKSDDVASVNIDIVAVHGLGAHPDDTWSKNVGSKDVPCYVNWLSDAAMLPAAIPSARIMRYGYESGWFGHDAVNQSCSDVARRLLLALSRSRKDAPDRPLIFISHCFGGLVVLKALLDAKEDEEEWPGTFMSTTGLIFFGTPFRGAEGMNQSEMLDAARREYDDNQIQGDVLRTLQPGNEFLQEIVDRFGKIRLQSRTRKVQVACFYETKVSDVGAIVGGLARTRFIVSRSSGCLDLSESTEKYSLSRNHFYMNKFGRPEEEDYQTVSDIVKRMVRNSKALLHIQTPIENGSQQQEVLSHSNHRSANVRGIEATKTSRPSQQNTFSGMSSTSGGRLFQGNIFNSDGGSMSF